MKKISEKTKDFNNFRFENLNWHQVSNNYYSMNRVSEDEKKIVVKVADEHFLSIAKEQRDYKDEDGDSVNVVRWEI